MRRLLRAQQPDNQELLPATLDWWVARLLRSRQAFYSAGTEKRISSNENSEGWQMENSFPNAVWLFWVSSHVFRSFQRPRQLPRIHQQNFSRKTWCFRHRLPWWHPDLHRKHRQMSCERCPVSSWRTLETRLVCQSEKVLFSLGKSSLSKLHRI